jgi:hypothetical protein
MPAEPSALLGLGVVLGRNEALDWVSGRCSAARAANLLMIKETGKYKVLTPHWQDFCPNYLKMSRAEVDRIIRLYQEFGENYFKVAQFAPVSAETYRAIQPAIQDGAIHYNGEVLDMAADNAKQVAAVVAQIRRDTAEMRKANVDDRRKLLALDKKCGAILSEFAEFSGRGHDDEHWKQFAATLERMRAGIAQIARESQL